MDATIDRAFEFARKAAQELDEELDFLAAILSTGIGEVTGSVSLNVLSKDLEAAMAIFMDAFIIRTHFTGISPFFRS